jgi:hypothetical protein
MLPAIDLDDQLRFRAKEIDDVWADRLLAAEADSLDLAKPKLGP